MKAVGRRGDGTRNRRPAPTAAREEAWGGRNGHRARVRKPVRRRRPVALAVKRGIDVVGSLVGLLLSLPLVILVAAAIKIEDRGPILFVQERLGQDGRAFRMFKLRSMVVGADRLAEGPRVREGDERITAVGRVLRRFSLDELPQLLNVLRGEMSLVGPRPVVRADLERFSERQRARLRVRPGITGLAQVSGRATIPWRERIEHDLRYVSCWSLGLDLRILARTVVTVFRGEELYATRDPWAPGGDGRVGARPGQERGAP